VISGIGKNRRWPPERSDAWPQFVDGKKSIACWTHPDHDRRVFLICREDGTFSKLSQIFSHDEFENCWIPEDSGGSFFDSEETAIHEIHGQFPWSKDVEQERRNAEP
jgi:hypothetical protein